MSKSTVHHTRSKVNGRRKYHLVDTLDPAEIPNLWRDLSAMESLAPDAVRGGLARARTRLLDNIPPWQIPQILDQLQEVTA